LHADEYEAMFLRTRMEEPIDMVDKRQFLDTWVNYRLKLREAKEQNVAAREVVREELQSYRNQLAKTFLYEHELKQPGMRQLYERRKEEVHLQHIVIKWLMFEDGSLDTLSTRDKAQRIFAEVKNSPLSFDTLVMRYSDDGSRERTRGKLGWFIAGQSFPQLDDMAYGMQVGDIAPQLLRTVFGYHIFKLIGRKPSRQRLRPAHILYRLDLNNPNDTAAAYAHLSLVLDSLRNGLATFEELARRNSQDSVSGANGGDLGWMNRGVNLEPNFETALFNLEEGEVSSVVRTAFGMHIIKVLDEEPPLPYEGQEDDLRRIYMNERFAMDYLNYIKRMREEYDFTLHDKVVKILVSRVDSGVTTSTPEWERALQPQDFDAYLFSTKIGPVSVREAIAFSRTEPTMQMRPISPPTFDTLAMMMADERIALDQTRGFEEKYPEFARLLREYTESTLISTLEDELVWNRVQVSEDSVRAWWETRKENFRLPARVQFAEIYTYTEKLANAYIDSLNNGADFQELAARYTQRPGLYSSRGAWDYLPVDENALSKAAARLEIGEGAGPIKFQSGFSLIKLLDRQPPRVKTFEEAKSGATAAYKEYRAEELRSRWLQSLRDKFRLQTYPDHLENTFVSGEGGDGEN
ncbi:MAG: peptidylprolyl isomerase, partial [Bacteroidota bacterium]|nr:peptidylprolyl isomerase [Bacteroidota bacterium]